MSGIDPSSELLTLEPLIDVVRSAVEASGWALSGLQKTTSHQFEGRWDGESTRSAYLFFHTERFGDLVSIDVYLDETSRGLTGNLALVVDLPPAGELGGMRRTLQEAASVSLGAITPGARRPVTLRFRLADAADDPADAETEVRFKVRLSRALIGEGREAVDRLCRATTASFEAILADPAVAEWMRE